MGFNQLASESFNIANENPLSHGGLWTTGYTGYGSLAVVSNQCNAATTAGSGCLESYTATTPPSDQYSEDTIITYTTGGASSGGGPCVRMAASPTATFYFVDTNGTDFYRISKSVAGVTSVLTTTSTVAASGQTRRLAAIGSTLFLYVNGALAGTASDTAIASGFAGEYIYAGFLTTNTVTDNWAMGAAYLDMAPMYEMNLGSIMVGRRYA